MLYCTHKLPSGNPLTRFAQVVVAAMQKWHENNMQTIIHSMKPKTKVWHCWEQESKTYKYLMVRSDFITLYLSSCQFRLLGHACFLWFGGLTYRGVEWSQTSSTKQHNKGHQQKDIGSIQLFECIIHSHCTTKRGKDLNFLRTMWSISYRPTMLWSVVKWILKGLHIGYFQPVILLPAIWLSLLIQIPNGMPVEIPKDKNVRIRSPLRDHVLLPMWTLRNLYK